MKEKREITDIYNVKGTISREILNAIGANDKHNTKLALYCALNVILANSYMEYNNIKDTILTLAVKTGVNSINFYQAIIAVRDIIRNKKSRENLDELSKLLELDDGIKYYSITGVFESLETQIILNNEIELVESVKDNKYKCVMRYTDSDFEDITDKIENITGGIKSLKQNK